MKYIELIFRIGASSAYSEMSSAESKRLMEEMSE
jgi:hypothetical protein